MRKMTALSRFKKRKKFIEKLWDRNRVQCTRVGATFYVLSTRKTSKLIDHNGEHGKREK